MLSIYKYILPVIDEQTILLPVGYRILSVQNQNDYLSLWAIVGMGVEREEVYFRIFGTGQPINTEDLEGLTYLGTVQIKGMVWHVFYRGRG